MQLEQRGVLVIIPSNTYVYMRKYTYIYVSMHACKYIPYIHSIYAHIENFYSRSFTLRFT